MLSFRIISFRRFSLFGRFLTWFRFLRHQKLLLSLSFLSLSLSLCLPLVTFSCVSLRFLSVPVPTNMWPSPPYFPSLRKVWQTRSLGRHRFVRFKEPKKIYVYTQKKYIYALPWKAISPSMCFFNIDNQLWKRERMNTNFCYTTNYTYNDRKRDTEKNARISRK